LAVQWERSPLSKSSLKRAGGGQGLVEAVRGACGERLPAAS
jgi:hypothetical protein